VSDERIAQVAIDFIAFCFERKAAGWPVLYDEMCYVAGKRLYRGLGYEELEEAGLDFTLAGLARTSRLVNEVTRQMRHGALAAT
jgi:ribosomal protein L13E